MFVILAKFFLSKVVFRFSSKFDLRFGLKLDLKFEIQLNNLNALFYDVIIRKLNK